MCVCRRIYYIKTAYFTIPHAVKHGQDLVCSYPACAAQGVKFCYCIHCGIPVAKRNFRQRHGHGRGIKRTQKSQSAWDNIQYQNEASIASSSTEAMATAATQDYNEPPGEHDDGTDARKATAAVRSAATAGGGDSVNEGGDFGKEQHTSRRPAGIGPHSKADVYASQRRSCREEYENNTSSSSSNSGFSGSSSTNNNGNDAGGSGSPGSSNTSSDPPRPDVAAGGTDRGSETQQLQEQPQQEAAHEAAVADDDADDAIAPAAAAAVAVPALPAGRAAWTRESLSAARAQQWASLLYDRPALHRGDEMSEWLLSVLQVSDPSNAVPSMSSSSSHGGDNVDDDGITNLDSSSTTNNNNDAPAATVGAAAAAAKRGSHSGTGHGGGESSSTGTDGADGSKDRAERSSPSHEDDAESTSPATSSHSSTAQYIIDKAAPPSASSSSYSSSAWKKRKRDEGDNEGERKPSAQPRRKSGG